MIYQAINTNSINSTILPPLSGLNYVYIGFNFIIIWPGRQRFETRYSMTIILSLFSLSQLQLLSLTLYILLDSPPPYPLTACRPLPLNSLCLHYHSTPTCVPGS